MTNRLNNRCESCGSPCFTKMGVEGISDLRWECNNCGAETPRVEFKARTTGEFTKTQIESIANITEHFCDVKVQRHHGGSLWVTFNNGEDHILLHESFCATISVTGWIHIKSADRALANPKHQKVIADLAGYKLGGKCKTKLMKVRM